MRIIRLFVLSALVIVSGIVSANDYPTIETVRYVVNCMVDNGGQNEENLYACTCRFDAISKAVTFQQYEDVSVFVRNKAMPGEKGAVFRDLGNATKGVRAKYEAAVKTAEDNCPIAKRVTRSVKDK
ncbi:MAG: hypothetical protein GKR93_06320 [Gammaproteobacteria bacterium]|nr:hypothetical protein [Gammaproteobacteria bacterium]